MLIFDSVFFLLSDILLKPMTGRTGEIISLPLKFYKNHGCPRRITFGIVDKIKKIITEEDPCLLILKTTIYHLRIVAPVLNP